MAAGAMEYVSNGRAEPLSRKQFEDFCSRTAANLVTDYHRARSRQRRWCERRPRHSEGVDCKLDLGAGMERMLARLTARERALLWLAYLEQAEHREIAEILGIGEKSVKVALHRARVKMEGILKAHEFEGAI
jgi:RNA polymerase sigma-70 factor (ECF subfamily)